LREGGQSKTRRVRDPHAEQRLKDTFAEPRYGIVGIGVQQEYKTTNRVNAEVTYQRLRWVPGAPATAAWAATL
jgi:hypothetical protein